MKPLRLLSAVVGGLLLALAGVLSYDTNWFYSDAWRVLIRLPGGVEQTSFPVAWVIVGLLLVGTLCAMRYALRAFRSAATAVPLVLALLFLAFSLFPWEFSWIRPSRSHIVLYLALGTGGLTLLVYGLYDQLRVFDRPVRRCYEWLMAPSPGRFVLLVFSVAFVINNLVSYFGFEHMPHVADGIAQLFQARIFAAGKLFLPSPPMADFFDYGHIISNGRWYSQYPFLHSLLMAPFVLLRAPWLLNPLLGALFVVALYRLGREVYDERVGRLGAVFALLSPFVLGLSAEYMNHSSALLLVTLFLLFGFRACGAHGRTRTDTDGHGYDWLLSGLFLGLVACVRPLTALAVAGSFGLYLLYRALREPRRYAAGLLMLVLGAGLTAALLLIYNQWTNGNPLLFGYVVKHGPGHELGFGKSGWGAQHTPLRGLLNTGHDLNLLNKFLFEWPIPALLPLVLLFAGGTRDRRDWLLLAGYLGLVVAHYFYWAHGLAFGPRFVYEASGALLLLTVRGGQELGAFLRRVFVRRVTDEQAATFIGRVLPVLLLIMLGVGLPPLFRMYHTYWGVDARLVRNVQRQGLHNALVFCAEFGDALNANSLRLDGDVVYARDCGPLNPALTSVYPGRQCYRANKSELTLLTDAEYSASALKRTLDSLALRLSDSLLAGYKTIIWPLEGLVPPGLRRPVTDFRTLTNDEEAGRPTLDTLLPALACWVVGDKRELLGVFTYMDRSQYYVMDKYKVRRVAALPDGRGAIFEIRRSGE